jgi:predicted PurR-regulated permease PerM
MSRQNLYLTLINTLIGIGMSLLLKGNILVFVLAFIIVGTILFIERKWLNEKIFRNKKSWAVAGYATVAVFMIVSLVFITKPSRETSAIVKTVHGFLDQVKIGDYKNAYAKLAMVSQQTYFINDFINDHNNNHIKIQDYRIDEVAFNKFDDHKAVAIVSSPFLIYGQETLPIEMAKEEDGWRIVFSKAIVQNRPISSKKKSSGGAISGFFKKLF